MHGALALAMRLIPEFKQIMLLLQKQTETNDHTMKQVWKIDHDGHLNTAT